MWTPDVYEGAPTPVVGFFAGAPKLAAMVLSRPRADRSVRRGHGPVAPGPDRPGAASRWSSGAFAGLAQNNLKRLWAYSSIANIGYALVGLAAGGAAGIQSMLVFMVLYIIDVTGFFACLAALSRDGRPMETMDDFAGPDAERPGLALAMTAFSLSALGLPPFCGFWGKFYVFKAAIGAGPGMGGRRGAWWAASWPPSTIFA